MAAVAVNDDSARRRVRLACLTGAEQRILELRATGATVDQIAALLSIPEGVAAVGLAHVSCKLGLEHLSAPARLLEYSQYLPVLAQLTRDGVPPAPVEVVGPRLSHTLPETVAAGVLADEALLTRGGRRFQDRLPSTSSRWRASRVRGRLGSRAAPAARRPVGVERGMMTQPVVFTPAREVGPSIVGRRFAQMALLAPAVRGAPATRSWFRGRLRSWASRVGAASTVGAVALVLWVALGGDPTRRGNAGGHSAEAMTGTASAAGVLRAPAQSSATPAAGRGDHASAAAVLGAEAGLERAAGPAGVARVPAPGVSVPDAPGSSLSETARGTVLGPGESWLQGGLRVAVQDPLPLPAQDPCGPGLAFTLVVANETQQDLFGTIDWLDWVATDGSGHRYAIAAPPDQFSECPIAGPGERATGWFGLPALIHRSFRREYRFVVTDPDARLRAAPSIRLLITRLAAVRDATWDIPLSPRVAAG